MKDFTSDEDLLKDDEYDIVVPTEIMLRKQTKFS